MNFSHHDWFLSGTSTCNEALDQSTTLKVLKGDIPVSAFTIWRKQILFPKGVTLPMKCILQ
jgi:hypothetical protein